VAMNNFGDKNFMQPMGRLSMHPRWALFSPFGGGVGAVIFYFSSFFLLHSWDLI